MAAWMLYGATGYTGVLVAEEAVRRGHQPLLAGRSESKLKSLAERLNLEYVAFDLDDTAALHQALSRVDAVYHAAGPFIHTSEPMLRACLNTRTHYLDITGEISVYQNAFACDAVARESGIVILPGVGFDVVPSDCLIKYVADQLPDADTLEVVVDALGTNISAGTAKSQLEIIASVGNIVRRQGDLVQIPFGSGAKWFTFPHSQRLAMPAPWGDVEMAYHATGIPNITAYMAFPPLLIRFARLAGGVIQAALKIRPLRQIAGKAAEKVMLGPSDSMRETGRSWMWARVSNPSGQTVQAWMQTPEAYHYTAIIGVRAVERVLDGAYCGTLTPASAFGADFALEVEGTQRYDSI